jgi:hypothetical protein
MKNQTFRRVNIFSKLSVFALLNSLLVTVSSAALPDISINFPGCCNNDADPLYSTPTTLLPTEVAGVVPRGNWNNVSGNSVHDAVLNDSNGTPTAVTIYFDADESWGSNAGKTSPNHKLLNGYLGISNDGHYRPLLLKNVPNGAYKLLMYNGRGDNQPQGYTVNPASVNTTLHIMPQGWVAGGWDGVWIRGTSTNAAARDLCNYVQFDEIAPVNGTITIDCRSEAFRGMMNGIQLIPLDPGAFRFVNQPADVNVNEGGSASFHGDAVDGTGTVTYQWLTNGVPDTANTTTTYNRTNLNVNENGRTFALVATDSTAQSVTSRVAVLTVNSQTKLISAATSGRTNKVFATFGAAVALTGTYTLNNGATVFGVSYGATHNDVILDTSILAEGLTYTLTATGETREDNGDPTVPNPTTINFLHGFGRLCTDFATLPVGTALFNNGVGGAGYLGDDGTGTNMVVHLTDDIGGDGAYGKWFISNRVAGAVSKILDARWRMRIGGDVGGHADGVCFNWADNLAADGNFVASEEGEGFGVSFIIDTWDNGSGPDTGIEIKWQASRIAFLHLPRTSEGDANFIAKDVFVDSSASVNSAGLATFTYNGNTISATIPGWSGIANGAYAFSARTGGEKDNFWIDDVCINNFTIGPVFFTKEPVDTLALEGLPATFTATVDGSPDYYYQWFTNGVPVLGANSSSYTTGPATAAMEGMQISVVASNLFSSVTSSNATLHVNISPRVVQVFSQSSNEVHVIWTRDMELFSGAYDLDNGVFEVDRRFGATHREVIIITDPLSVNTTYTLMIIDATEEGVGANVQFPNPTTAQFRQGFGFFCADFNDNLVPAGTTLRNNGIATTARVEGGILHLTDAINDQNGTFFVPDPAGGFQIDRLLVKFKMQISHPNPAQRIADGMSFSFGQGVTVAANGGEEGVGNGIVVTFDTWDNNAPDTAPALEVRYKGTVVATQAMAGIREAGRAQPLPFFLDDNGNPLSLNTSNAFANFLLSVSPSGKMDLYFKDYVIFQNVQLPNYTGFQGGGASFGARTGGANENAWIDDLCINGFSLGGVAISGPADASIPELTRALFKLDVDGLPPYGIQWYSNNVPIPGATALVYHTPVVDRNADGAQYFAIVTNQFSSATSRVATLTIIRDLVAPTIVSAEAVCIGDYTNVLVKFSERLNVASATTAANYAIDHGITVNSAVSVENNRWVLLNVSPALDPLTCYKLTVNNVKDVTTYNTIAANTMVLIRVPRPILGSGPQNMLVIEAEDFDSTTGPTAVTPVAFWTPSNSLPGAVGAGYLDATPNVGNGSGDDPTILTNASTATYCVNFPVAGTYYLWARGSTANDGANNSFHFGIDGVTPTDFTRRVGNRISNWGGDAGNVNAFGWVRDVNGNGVAGSVAQVNIVTPGRHILNIWMREDGIKLDRFLFTTDAAFTLTTSEAGPAASARSADPSKLSIVHNPDSTVTVSWPGIGFRLQTTPTLGAPITWRDVDTGGANTYTFNPSNEFNVFLDAIQSGGGGRTGTGSGIVSFVGTNLLVDVSYSGLSGNRTDDHFHAPAPIGANASVVYGLAGITTGNQSGLIKGVVPMTDGKYGGKTVAQQVEDIRNKLWYLNIHTSPTFGGGEIRGQVEQAGTRYYRLVCP